MFLSSRSARMYLRGRVARSIDRHKYRGVGTSKGRVRVRYAPSPTGELHIGGLRTALFNYIFAKQHDGDFILRIEDTDRARYVDGSVERLVEMLIWCGLKPDEGPGDLGGCTGPYVQSERLDIYADHAEKLIRADRAYRCFCVSKEPVVAEMDNNDVPLRDFAQNSHDENANACNECMGRCPTESEARARRGDRHVVRMKIPGADPGVAETTTFEDYLRGSITIQNRQIDHQVLVKSDGWPTYHLASVVDDRMMGISHVIRGDEWLSSTAKHAILYDAFGWERPTFVHVPLLLNSDRSKISKRQAHAGVSKLRSRGILPSALLNFAALMGWSPSEYEDDARGGHSTVLRLDEIVDAFSLRRVKVSPAIVNPEKLESINTAHLLGLCDSIILRSNGESSSLDEHLLTHAVEPFFTADLSLNFDDFGPRYVASVLSAMEGRVGPEELLTWKARYFFEDPSLRSLNDDEGEEVIYQVEAGRRVWSESAKAMLLESLPILCEIPENDFGGKSVKRALRKVSKSHKAGLGKVMMPLRYALTGSDVGADIVRTIDILPRDVTLRRLRCALDTHDAHCPEI